MRRLGDIITEIEAEMDERDTVRELALKSTRTLTRLASTAIRGMHRGEDVAAAVQAAVDEVGQLRTVLGDHPDLFRSGLVENGLQEVAEAAIVQAIVRDRPLPAPREIGVTSAAYLLGLADAVGELRRFALDALRTGDLARSQAHLETMEEVFDALLRFDYPTAVVAIKRKQDVARGLIERTRGEIAVAARGLELERKLDAVSKRM